MTNEPKQKANLETVVKYLKGVADHTKALGYEDDPERIYRIIELMKQIDTSHVDEEKLAVELAKRYCKETRKQHPCYLRQKERDEQEYWARDTSYME